MERNVKVLAEAGFSVRAIVSDNHSSNVNAYSNLSEKFESGSSNYIQHPSNDMKTYLIFDTVHLMKNIRNNLLNKKNFVFPSFNFNESSIALSCPIAWSYFHKIYENVRKLKGNLRKAPKLSYQALHPGNNKQSIPLALSIFDETTIAATRSYMTNREDMASFLEKVNTWWLVANSKQKCHWKCSYQWRR